MKELIEKHAKEIMSMLTTEWNWDTAKKVWQDEAREEGREEGEEKSRKYFLEMIDHGLSIDEIKERLKN